MTRLHPTEPNCSCKVCWAERWKPSAKRRGETATRRRRVASTARWALIGAVAVAGLLMAAYACAGPRARQGTVDHNVIEVPVDVDAQIEAKVAERVQAGLANFETRVGKIETTVGLVGPIGGTHAGGNVTTTDSRTSRINAWTGLITVAGLIAYMALQRFGPTRRLCDWVKGKPTAGTRELRPGWGAEAERHYRSEFPGPPGPPSPPRPPRPREVG